MAVVVAGCDWVFGLEARLPDDAPPPPPPEWKSVTTGARHTCAIQVDQTLWCWGENARGEAAQNDAIAEVLVPAMVNEGPWTAVAAGTAHTCAIEVDGDVWCWGANSRDAIGGNIAADHLPLTRVLAGAIAITAGGSHTCAIKSDHSLWCWGRGDEGQLATGQMGVGYSEPLPVQVASGQQWSQIDGGLHHTCGITVGQELWCWGENANQQVQIGGGSVVTLPLLVEAGTAWTDLALGYLHTCAVRSNGTLRCAGFNNNGQLGVDGALSGSAVDVPTGALMQTWKRVTASVHQTCALRDDGTLWCFGTNAQNQLGLPGMDAVRMPTQTGVDDLGALAEIALGGSHLCAINAGGLLWCAGSNGAGQLGDGTGGGKPAPVQVAGAWELVDVGGSTACARDTTGALQCWGHNSDGELADTTVQPRHRPQFVIANALEFAVGSGHACAETPAGNGTVYCWGKNHRRQLGTGTASDRELSVVASGFTNPIALVAGTHTCASAASGSLFCWGSNSHGQLGLAADDFSHPLSPMMPSVGVFSSRTAAGLAHTCDILSSDDLQCWGDNQFGQRGTVAAGTGPLPVAGGIRAISLGDNHSCAITTSAGLACWGANSQGQVGDAGTTDRATPRPIGVASWKSIALGRSHSCGRQLDDSLWCWGDNARGQLGDGTRTDRGVPTRIGTATDWSFVAAGGDETCALKADQTLWCWGANVSGQIGDGSAWTPTFVRVEP